MEASGESPVEQLRGIVDAMFHGWRHHPDVVCVVIREIARSAEVGQRVGELVKPIGAIRRIVERGQSDGDFAATSTPTPPPSSSTARSTSS